MTGVDQLHSPIASMEAPGQAKILDVSGRWLLNRSLSDSTEASFALQGIPWIVRKIINFASLELQYVQLPPPPGSTAARFGFKQTVSPGGFNTSNEYIFDGQKRVDTVPIFGEISARCRYIRGGELAEHVAGLSGADVDDMAILEVIQSEAMGWSASTVWVFEAVGGERRLVKHNTTTKGEQVEKARIVFDYLGPPHL